MDQAAALESRYSGVPWAHNALPPAPQLARTLVLEPFLLSDFFTLCFRLLPLLQSFELYEKSFKVYPAQKTDVPRA